MEENVHEESGEFLEVFLWIMGDLFDGIQCGKLQLRKAIEHGAHGL